MQDFTRNDSLLAVVGALWKRYWRVAISVFLLVFAATTSFVYSLPGLYRARATVLVNPGVTAAQPAQDGTAQDVQLDSVTEEVLSRARLQGIIARYDLYPDLRRRFSSEAVLDRMRRDIHVERKTGDQQWGRDSTFAFTLEYQGWSPQTVAEVTNALVSSYVDENNRMRNRQAEDSIKSLEVQMSSIKQKLDGQQQRIDAFKNSHIGELPEQQATNMMTIQQLDGQLHENSENQLRAAQRSEALLKEMADSGNATLAQLEQEESSLLTRYTDQYPDVVRIRAEIAAMKRAQADPRSPDDGEAARTVSPLQQQYQAASAELRSYKEEEARLRGEINDYRQRIENVPLREQQLQTLMQGYDETNEVYSSLLKRYEEARLALSSSGQGGSQYRILDPAVTPVDAVGPNRPRLLFMALMFSIVVAAAVVFGIEQFDASFHSVDELRSFTHVSVLASIPLIITRADVIRRRVWVGVAVLLLASGLLLAIQLSWFMGHDNQQLVWTLSGRG